jgi:gas vesicle protein
MSQRSKVFGAAVTGLIAGAIAGILLAPKSGKETRQDIARLAGRMKADLTDRLEHLGEITREAYDDAVSEVVHQYEKAREITKDEASQLKEELGQSYQEVKQSVEEHNSKQDPA